MKKIVNIFIGQNWQNHCDILSNDAWFNENVLSDIEFLSKHLKLIEKLDHSKINLSTLTIRSGYGKCSLEKLGTGIKCLLNCMYLKEKPEQLLRTVYFDAGDYIFPLVCKEIANTNIFLCVTRDCLNMPEKYLYLINGAKLENTLDFVDMLAEHEKDVIDFKWVENELQSD